MALKAAYFNVPYLSTHDYQIHLSKEINDEAWDAFLLQTPGGHHVQTSLWAQVKQSMGWRSLRVIATHKDEIVAGAQILVRSVPWIGGIGYVSQGPLFALRDPALRDCMIRALKRTAFKDRIQYLSVHPPAVETTLSQELLKKGFQAGNATVAPGATLLLDLTKDVETLLGEMKIKTRYNVRLGQRKGIAIREGTVVDLNTYYTLLEQTSRRQEFAIFPLHYFQEMWRILHPCGYLKLFLAEYEGNIVAAQLVISFGDTVINKLSVWSGQHGNCRPNEALQWATIQWAKAQGYRYYDFEGISLEAATALQVEGTVPDHQLQTITSFKLGFGGEVKRLPAPICYIYNPLLAWGYRTLYMRYENHPTMLKIAQFIRTKNQKS